MTQERIHPASPEFIAQANIGAADYERLYRESVEDSSAFWSRAA